MSCTSCEIKRSNTCEAYELVVDGKFCGNYDTVAEAANEYESLCMQEEQSAFNEEG